MLPGLKSYTWRSYLIGPVLSTLLICVYQSSLTAPLDSGGQPVSTPIKKVHFESDVLPILKANCVQCHGSETRIKEMNLGTLEGVLKGSESGPVVMPGKADESRLYKMVHEGLMPPGGKTRLTEEQVATIRAWIEAGVPSASQSVETAEAAELTQHDILPIVLLRCTACHGLRRQDGGLDLHTRAAMLKGGKSGPALVPGKPEESLIVKKIRSGEMPPKKTMLTVSVKPITSAETEKLAKWIARGAPEGNLQPDVVGREPDPLVTDKDRQFWAFQPPRSVQVPSVRHVDRVRNPIDAFILSKLEEKDLTLSPEADRLTLIRRVYFDLTGLPPEPDVAQAFLSDPDPGAYEELVDRLLASPRYGERWGRYWLDLAGYADSEGGKLSADHPRPNAFRYRDYVIRSFNADKPYDRFLLEQVAGDELIDYEHAPAITQEMMDNLIATGFLRMGPDSTTEREVNFAEDRLDVISDEIDVFSAGVLGLTMKCAKCHSHKYDPIPQRDYYRLLAVFKGAYDEHDWLMPQHAGDGGKIMGRRYLSYIRPGATPVQLLEEEEQRQAHNRDIEREVEAVKAALEQKAELVKQKVLEQRLAQIPPALQQDLRKLLATPPEKRNEVEKKLAEKYEKVLKVETGELKQFDDSFRKEAESAERRMKVLESQELPEPKICALWDRGTPSPTYILRRGEPANFGRLVGPGVPSVLTDGKTAFEPKPPWTGAQKTGRRLALAQWLIQPDNPLTSRVMVNRIWKHHFGTGLVKTLGNFGNTGARPTHPELLDWLAREFVSQGWSLKSVHRLLMTSSTYRQASAVTPALEQKDPENQLLSRMPLRRMEAEVLYDTLLQVSRRLDETRYGTPEPVYLRGDGLVTPIETEKGWRRSVYVEQRRTEMPTLLENFDLPPMSPNCLERNVSTVAPQALQMLNNAMIYNLAASLAKRVEKEAGSNPERQIERAYWIALGRPPSAEERKISLDALARLNGGPNGQYPASSEAAPRGVPSLKPVPAEKNNAPLAVDNDTPDPGNSAHKALAKFCHTLLNSASFLYVD